MRDRETILLVDDTTANRYAQRRVLEHAGYEVLEAGTGQDGLRLVHEAQPDLVILDVKLPDVDGFEVARRLRADPRTRRLQILHLSATYQTPEYKARGLEAGADGYLTSPIEPVVLIATVRALLRVRKAEREQERFLEQAQQALRARDEFATMVVHDLRDPLSGMLLRLGSMARRISEAPGSPIDRLSSDVAAMRLVVERMDRMLKQLLDATVDAHQRVPLDLDEVDLAALTRDIVERERIRFQEAGCVLSVRAHEPVRGRWDRARLDQVLSNLLANAVAYGKGRPVDVIVDQDADRARLIVRDHGVGISRDDQARIFKSFERAAAHLAPRGFGLGLYTVQRVCEALGGLVAVHSELGEGAEFVIDLPKAGPTMN
jgi:signal transduction histidine kinase